MDDLILECVVLGVPISSQGSTHRKDVYRRNIIQAVKDSGYVTDPATNKLKLPTRNLVSVTINYFCEKSVLVALDLDNLAKIMLDALKNLVYADDKQVINIMLDKRQIGIVEPSGLPNIVLSTLSNKKEFVYLVVRSADEKVLIL